MNETARKNRTARKGEGLKVKARKEKGKRKQEEKERPGEIAAHFTGQARIELWGSCGEGFEF